VRSGPRPRDVPGVGSLLPGHAEVVASVVAGRDTLAILPTGGGKSAIYQLAGVSMDGPTSDREHVLASFERGDLEFMSASLVGAEGLLVAAEGENDTGS
jgi:ATP-dependent DNA helicase RecQ